MTDGQQIITTLSHDIIAGLTTYASQKRMGLPETASRIVTEFIAKQLTGQDRERIDAEIVLYDEIESILDRLEAENTWDKDEDVTSNVFAEVEKKHLDVFQKAIGGGDPRESGNHHKARINKRIGARIKARLGAEVIYRDGKRAKGQCTGRIIVSWTKLCRPGPAS
jgi:hypothetical protein